MSKDQAETIRSAMAGFQLPESAIPSWASQLSDEEEMAAQSEHAGSLW